MGVEGPADSVSLDVPEPVNSETVSGFRAIDELDASGERVAARLTLPANSSRLVMSMVKVVSEPCERLMETGLEAMVKSGAGGLFSLEN